MSFHFTGFGISKFAVIHFNWRAVLLGKSKESHYPLTQNQRAAPRIIYRKAVFIYSL